MKRRRFLQYSAAAAVLAAGAPRGLFAASEAKQPPFEIATIEGAPRESGKMYGERFGEAIRAFLDREILGTFVGKPASREQLLAYGKECGEKVREFSPEIYEECLGIAEGAGIARDEQFLITLHEELYHRSTLPPISHCTAVAVGPPATRGKAAFVGQTWDWMESVAGLSTMLHWKRATGPSVLAYAFPGLWVGAGLNSAGLALCWTSADLGKNDLNARVGIPSYILLAHLLYQESLDAALAEARRAVPAGWFTFVMADGEGRLANIEGSPKEVAVEEHRGALARVSYGSRQMTKTPAPDKIEFHPRCQKMYDLLDADRGRIDRERMQRYFADPTCGICAGRSTLDLMVFDTAERVAWLSRGEAHGLEWRSFTFV
jgi:hypothetical protein